MGGLASCAAMFATYWDDAWHTDTGRDEFAIPPHLLLYGSVLAVAAVIVAWGLTAWRQAGWGVAGVGAVLRQPPLLLGAMGGATTLGSAPVDNLWHEWFGRDAVLWSPPHLTAVLGTVTLAACLLAGLRDASGRVGTAARTLCAAGLMGALQIPALEYDTDVPQFGLVWFFPVAALGTCAALALLSDLLPGEASATAAIASLCVAALFTLLRVVSAGVLVALGHSAPFVPPVLAVFAVDALLRRRPLSVRLLAAAAVTPALWWVCTQLQPGAAAAVSLDLVPVATMLSVGAALLVALLHGDLRLPAAPLRGAAGVLLVVVGATSLLMTAGAPRAWAHDPGQGQQLREGQLTVARDAKGVALVTLVLPGGCDGLAATRTLARRSGVTLSGPLAVQARDDRCVLTGQVRGLSAGRWFVYTEARRGEQRLEAWLPTAPAGSVTEVRPLYAPRVAPSGWWRTTAGTLLVGVCAALLRGILRLSRRAAQHPALQE